MRFGFRALAGAAVVAALVVPAAPGPAVASSGPAGFEAQARAAGLPATRAAALQAKVDRYLAELAGRPTQVSPNQIDLDGAVLTVTVPGEEHPRQLAAAARAELRIAVCSPSNGAAYGYFCAFERENFRGDFVAMYHCDAYFIPYRTVGSWDNYQTPGTVPTAYFTDGSWWNMPAAPSRQKTGVDWSPVQWIVNC